MKELFNNLISVQFGASIAIVLLLLSRRIMKKRYVAKLRYWLWLVIALRLCLPVDINIRLNRTAPVNIPVNDYYISAQLSQSDDQPTDFEIITADQLNLQPYAIDLETLEVLPLTNMIAKQSGGITTRCNIYAEIGNCFIISTGFEGEMIANIGVISKEDFFANKPQVLPLGQYRLF